MGTCEPSSLQRRSWYFDHLDELGQGAGGGGCIVLCGDTPIDLLFSRRDLTIPSKPVVAVTETLWGFKKKYCPQTICSMISGDSH